MTIIAIIIIIIINTIIIIISSNIIIWFDGCPQCPIEEFTGLDNSARGLQHNPIP